MKEPDPIKNVKTEAPWNSVGILNYSVAKWFRAGFGFKRHMWVSVLALLLSRVVIKPPCLQVQSYLMFPFLCLPI